jgi:hypothetical protein
VLEEIAITAGYYALAQAGVSRERAWGFGPGHKGKKGRCGGLSRGIAERPAQVLMLASTRPGSCYHRPRASPRPQAVIFVRLKHLTKDVSCKRAGAILRGVPALVAYQNGRLRVGKLRHRGVLEEELANYRLKQNLATGHTAFEPLREGQHDDLLFAVCLGCWAWEYGTKKIEYLSYPNQILTEIPPHLLAQYG